MSLQIELLILGKGPQKYGEFFSKLASDQSHRVHIVAESDEAKRKMYAAADIALFLSDPNELPELKHALSYGAVPVSPASDLLDDYNAVQESGNAFLYEKETMWHAFAALVRAVETYKFPFDWRTIQRHCMERVKQEEA